MRQWESRTLPGYKEKPAGRKISGLFYDLYSLAAYFQKSTGGNDSPLQAGSNAAVQASLVWTSAGILETTINISVGIVYLEELRTQDGSRLLGKMSSSSGSMGSSSMRFMNRTVCLLINAPLRIYLDSQVDNL